MDRSLSLFVIILSIASILSCHAIDTTGHRQVHLDAVDSDDLPRIEVGRNHLNNTLMWGSYRPHLYSAMKTRSTKPINTGLIWSTPNIDNMFSRFVHKCEQSSDGVVGYHWRRHDGKNFGEQEIVDRPGNLLLTTTFVKSNHHTSKTGGDWTVRLSGRQLNASLPVPLFSMMYYVLDESVTSSSDSWLQIANLPEDSKKGLTGDLQVNGNNPDTGRYTLQFNDVSSSTHPHGFKYAKSQPSVDKWHFYGKARFDKDKWNVINSIFDDTTKQHITSYYGEWNEISKQGRPQPVFIPTLPNIANDHTNTMIVQRVLQAPFDIEISFISHSTHSQSDQSLLSEHQVKQAAKHITGEKFDGLLEKYREDFEKRFVQHFPLAKGVNPQYREFGRVVLSSLLGGIGYWHGNTLATDPSNPRAHYKLPMSTLFSASPSRPAFPRGFLWDEGFHQLVISSWDVDLTIESLSHWFNLVNEDGWIPREQILGNEALSMVPHEFQVQSPSIANPPTLLMTVLKLIDLAEKYKASNEHKREYQTIVQFIEEAYPRMARFYSFYWRTQTANHIGNTFRWRGRKVNHTLASGLDDYPRANPPSLHEVHVDLSAWMAFASEAMGTISKFIGKDDSVYMQSYKEITNTLRDLHWDDVTSMYQDVVYDGNNNNKTFVRTEGYVNYFPLVLGLEPVDSPRLRGYLNTVKDIRGIWSRYGLRSMSLRDPHYGTNENYWRGPIWININYLFVSKFHQKYMKSGPLMHDFAMTYYTLRHNIIDNIFQQYKETGFLWEQYHGLEGTGERNHPFTGWTSLVLLMMSEQY
ncbi:hypothetical protein SAMD00019534_056270 [Acytostelium subglobosum LB1]|uniref:hypothetical protein n=1 Tax=Acytostelium subglobosum LB1 TaxID=1410327 RepID=UPI000644B124|nr:hypothetical protein SAMD00019534_056270 [Acytostelium subglobosum LB1]GAM22452.1 hypothetical protein SAMD00019534_056270 [Acytostelium subglobosum LB1]|eukprot:XP_012754572.1 hypothetical protein SAMD00019534_056270 [Acytostelium subglobosum LB1]